MPTETKQLSTHMQGKVIQLDYDFITSLTGECMYCLTDAQVEMILAIVDFYGWSTRWYSEDGLIDQEIINHLKGGLVEALMSGCCNDSPPLIFKWVGNVLYVSTDGGATYNPAPQYDYRNTSTLWPKPSDLGLDNSQCQCADGVVVAFRDKITQQVTDDMGAAAILAVIAAALLLFLSGGTSVEITPLVVGLVSAILTAGVTAWQAAFTSDVWDEFRCLVYNFMSDTESIDQAGIDSLYASMDGAFTGIVVPTLKGYINAAGLVGINNMLRSGEGDPDAVCCPDCTPSVWSVKNYDGVDIGTINSVGSNYLILGSTVHPDFGTHGVMIVTSSDITCCVPTVIEYLTGDEAGRAEFGVDCGDPRWPDTATSTFSLGSEELNTIYCRNTIGAFTVKITFA